MLSDQRKRKLLLVPWTCLRNRLHSMGVRESEIAPEMRIAMAIVTANSLSRRPRIPPMNSTGINTAASESVMERIVKPISRPPLSAASIGVSPCSMWRTMFSRTTMASSTTNPTARMRAMSEKLFTLNPRRYMPPNVPMIESGIAALGMSVARTFRRKIKITSTTSTTARSSVNSMSCSDWRIDRERS